MRFVLGNRLLVNVGGTEVHLAIVGEQLRRLGHETVMYSPELGPYADNLRGRGFEVTDALTELPEDCDVVFSQDALVAYDLAACYPEARHVFRICGQSHDFQLPPQLAGAVDLVVVLSDRYARIAAASAAGTPVVRLRIPVDPELLVPLDDIRAQPRKAVLLGNYPERFELVRSAWGELEVERVGETNDSSQRFDVSGALAGADIVVGKGRAALDGMACGRAVYVFDLFGGDGWITPELYPALEADQFAGLATERVIGREELARDLDEYDAAMGAANRDLVLQHHDARTHVVELLEALGEHAPPAERPVSSLREAARLASLQWSWESRARASESWLGAKLAEAQDARALAEHHRAVAEERAAELERRLAELERGFAESQALVEEMRATRAWRVASRYWALKARLRRRGPGDAAEPSSAETP
ncbi:MAG: hypothetical protein ACXVRE_05780 [Gaiellaceae bacterium]